MLDELKERNILKLILIVRFACAALDVGRPIFAAERTCPKHFGRREDCVWSARFWDNRDVFPFNRLKLMQRVISFDNIA
jgi:hypothetical protein